MELGFLANDGSKSRLHVLPPCPHFSDGVGNQQQQKQQDKTSDSNWISTEDCEEDKEISLFDSSSEEEIITNLIHQFLQTISFPKPKRGKKHLLQIMLVEQLCMSFDKVQDQRGFQNLSTQEQVILSLYICGLLFEKPYVSKLTNHKEPQYIVAQGNPCMIKNSKLFLV